MANTKISDIVSKKISVSTGPYNSNPGIYQRPEEEPKTELWLINRWESWNKAAFINTRNAIKKANADLKVLNLEKNLLNFKPNLLI